MRKPEDILRRSGGSLFSSVESGPNDECLTASQVADALTRMPKAESRIALDEMERAVEIERLRKIWDNAYMTGGGDANGALAKIRPQIDAIADGIKTATGNRRRQFVKQAKSLAHRLARMQQEDRKAIEQLAKRLERYDRAAAEVNRFLHGPMNLQRLEGSHFHRLLEADLAGDLFTSVHKGREAEHLTAGLFDATYGQASVFVVEHDWARAFESAPDVFTGPVKLPDEQCAFEFCIGGHIVVALIGQIDEHPSILPFIRTQVGWISTGSMISRNGAIGYIKALNDSGTVMFHDAGQVREGHFVPLRDTNETRPLYELIDRQVRAVGVALDAQVAVQNAVRMPYRSNQIPKGPAKPKPFYSYHTVSLARRPTRLEAREDDGLQVQGPKRRLHFRRGHWRHFDGWKTWVNWCLVGDPDLGFVDKHYRL